MSEKGYKDKLVSYVKNPYTKKRYCISTAKDIKGAYWSSNIFECRFFGLSTNFKQELFGFSRNTKEEAHKVHNELKKVLANCPRNEWVQSFPSAIPPGGWNDEAKAILKEYDL